MSIHPILVVDDEEGFLRSASLALRIAGYTQVATCSRAADAIVKIESGDYSLILLDIMMPDGSGLDLLPRIRALRPEVPIVMCTAVNEVETAVTCIRCGAFDYLVKPVDKARLLTTVENALRFAEVSGENRRLSESMLSDGCGNPDTFAPIITASERMRALFRYVEAISPTTLPVLIQGETGSGKELFARAVHDASGRRGEFVTVNVAGLDDALFSDTLFGHERGAFTGAERKRDGLVVKAANGTLFLDEIGDLASATQVKLLRLIEERAFYPVGSDTLQRTDARIVAATSVDLTAAAVKGTFRSDLFYRLKSHLVRIPPLRERKDDIAVLTRHFLAQAALEMGKPVPAVPPQLFTLLANHPFPGNIRELRGMVYDAVGNHAGGVMSLAIFREHLGNGSGAHPAQADADQPNGDSLLTFGTRLPTLAEADAAVVGEALRRCGNNQSQAARLLGITPSALNKRLNKI